MAMGTRDPEQPPLWIATSELPVSPGHPFYTRLNALLDAAGFDAWVEDACRSLYAPVLGRPSLAPGRYFRLMLVGYFEGVGGEFVRIRNIARSSCRVSRESPATLSRWRT